MTDLLLHEPNEDTFYCPGCERMVDVDCGAYDELAELCDDCAAAVWKHREAAERAATEGKGDG